MINFKAYMTSIYETEKQAMALHQPASPNLMTQLVRASLGSDGLSESEIYGNLFVFSFAGHDTTANTLTISFFLLASSPQIQTWIAEELNAVLGDNPPSSWNYTTSFPHLKRTLALLYETIRLYTPVPIAKSTGNGAQSVTVEGKEILIPGDVLIIPHYTAVHTQPKVWGPDSLSWKPSRWIKTDSKYPDNIEHEQFLTAQKGTFIPWSEGVRNCPGKKFSQVEFVAVIATILKDWYVEPKCFGNESLEEARRRVVRFVEEDTGLVLLLQILHPESTPLVWKRRHT